MDTLVYVVGVLVGVAVVVVLARVPTPSSMKDLPPAGSSRRRLAIGFWVAFTVLYVVLLPLAIYSWATGRSDVLSTVAVIAGVPAFVGAWRWIRQAARADN